MSLNVSILICLFFTLSIVRSKKLRDKLVVASKKSRSDKLTMGLGALILLGFALYYGDQWHHYLATAFAIVGFIAIRFTGGLTQEGVQLIHYTMIGPSVVPYNWRHVKEVEFSYSPKYKVMFKFDDYHQEISFDLEDDEKIKNLLVKHNVLITYDN